MKEKAKNKIKWLIPLLIIAVILLLLRWCGQPVAEQSGVDQDETQIITEADTSFVAYSSDDLESSDELVDESSDELVHELVQKPSKEAKAELPQEAEIQNETQIEPCRQGVIINGVCWAISNVSAPGTFAENPEGTGIRYQWNSKKEWSAPTYVGGQKQGWQDKHVSNSPVWEKANDPSPDGWRVPTVDELRTLCDRDKVNREWTSVNGVNGTKFTDKATGNTIFIPATGYRDEQNNNGTLKDVGTQGKYWGNTSIIDAVIPVAQFLQISRDNVYAGVGGIFKATWGSIRSVKE